MITYDEAYAATNPADPPEARELAAERLMLGTLANDVYWQSRGHLEHLQALADGHGVVYRGADPPVAGVDFHDSVAVDEPAPVAQVAAPESPPAAGTANAVEAVAKLRAQLAAAGIQPEA